MLMAWKEDAFQHPWDSLDVYAFPLVCFHPTGSVKSRDFDKPLHDPGGSSVTTKVMVPSSFDSSDGRTSEVPHAGEPASATPCKEVL